MTSRRRLLLVAIALTTNSIVYADPLAALNAVRSHPCSQYRAARALRPNGKLREAALRLAAGESFERAMKNANYRADRSSLIRLRGSVSDAEIYRALRTSLCATANDPGLTEAGSARRGDELWIVLANPFSPPAARDRDTVAADVVQRVNQARAAGFQCGGRYFPPARPLQLDSVLSRAAQTHADNMARLGFLEHRGRDGSSPAQRVRAAGYRNLGAVAENIAGGAMSVREAMEGWLASPGHCANLMDSSYTQMGVGYAANDESPLGVYWVEDSQRLNELGGSKPHGINSTAAQLPDGRGGSSAVILTV